MHYSIDSGGSTMDILLWDKNKIIKSWSKELSSITIGQKKFINLIKKLEQIKPEKIIVTGGKTKNLPEKIANIPLIKVREIDAIGYSCHDFKEKKKLIVSLGTGTCIVGQTQKKGKPKIQHLGGTGIGGGTFLALTQLLLKEKNLKKILKLYNEGNPHNVDISVDEIIAGALPKIPKEKTASNLGKIKHSKNYSRADLSSGIINLIGQSIGICATMAALYFRVKNIFLVGKLTKVKPIIEVIKETAKIYKIKIIVPKNPETRVAYGANQYITNNFAF